MGETPDLNPEANPNRAHDLLRSEGLNLPARDPLLRRSVCAAGQPASSQVSQRIGLAESDRKFPPLTGRSGTQRARGLQSRTTDGSVTPWSSLPSPGLFPATRPRPVLSQTPPSNPIAAEPDGRRVLSRGGAADHEVTPNAPLTDIPGRVLSSCVLEFFSVAPGRVLVIEGAALEASVQDADKTVG